jgi:hypothetical protein
MKHTLRGKNPCKANALQLYLKRCNNLGSDFLTVLLDVHTKRRDALMTDQGKSSSSSPEQQPKSQTTEQRITEPQRKMLHLLARAMKDEAWRQALLTNPKPLIEHELGITFSSGMTVEVHEDTSTTIHLVLPPRQLPPVEVSDADLEQVVPPALTGAVICTVGGECEKAVPPP